MKTINPPSPRLWRTRAIILAFICVGSAHAMDNTTEFDPNELLVIDGEKLSPLMIAARQNMPEACGRLIKHGADVPAFAYPGLPARQAMADKL